MLDDSYKVSNFCYVLVASELISLCTGKDSKPIQVCILYTCILSDLKKTGRTIFENCNAPSFVLRGEFSVTVARVKKYFQVTNIFSYQLKQRYYTL